ADPRGEDRRAPRGSDPGERQRQPARYGGRPGLDERLVLHGSPANPMSPRPSTPDGLPFATAQGRRPALRVSGGGRGSFTLVEVLVTMTIMAILLTLFTMVLVS